MGESKRILCHATQCRAGVAADNMTSSGEHRLGTPTLNQWTASVTIVARMVIYFVLSIFIAHR